MKKVVVTSLFCGLVLGVCMVAQAGDPRPIAQPYGDGFENGEWSFPIDRERAAIPIDHLVMGADHILDQQCHNGGFGWPHADCSATYHNITGPILLGSLGTFYHTRNDSFLVGPVNGGAFDLTYEYSNGESRFGSFTPMYLYASPEPRGIRRSRPMSRPDSLTNSTPGPMAPTISTPRGGSPVSRPAAAARGSTSDRGIFPRSSTSPRFSASLARMRFSNRAFWMVSTPSTTAIPTTSTPISSVLRARSAALPPRDVTASPRLSRPSTPASTGSTISKISPPIWHRFRIPTVRGTGTPIWRFPESETRMSRPPRTPCWR